jgi:hypothetical protein
MYSIPFKIIEHFNIGAVLGIGKFTMRKYLENT